MITIGVRYTVKTKTMNANSIQKNAGGTPGLSGALSVIRSILKGRQIFVAGGPVRDILLGRPVKDIDLVMEKGALESAEAAASALGGTLVILHEEEEVARVVLKEGAIFDFSSFRGKSRTIEGDLAMRDFTINAMAVPLELFGSFGQGSIEGLIDPFGGLADLQSRLIRAVRSENIVSDPLRMVRAFRFQAELEFTIEDETYALIEDNARLIERSAPERISRELDIMMASDGAGDAVKQMYRCGLLPVIIPEIRELEGVDQPGFHHLDVLNHCFEAVSCMDRLCADPAIKFHEPDPLRQWLTEHDGQIHMLKWAALFHDFGKPARKGVRPDGRVTFYEHDRHGAEQAKAIGRRLRWSRHQTEFVFRLVRLHMRPFHLLGDFIKGRLTKRAMRRLLRDTGGDYPALFLLAMADSMAGAGPLKPKDLDEQLARLFSRIHAFYLDHVKPIEQAPRLITGKDVMKELGIGPGPVVGRLLEAVEAARMDGRVGSSQEALELVKRLGARLLEGGADPDQAGGQPDEEAES